MRLPIKQLVRISIVCSLVFTLATSQWLQAQSSIVQPSELRNALKNASDTRQKNLEQVQSFFANDSVRKILDSSPFSSAQIQKAVSTLDADQLAKLANQTRKAQSDFAAGALTNEQLTYIVIALATAVIVLIIVKA
jgi:hypothetical protein